MFSFNLFLFLSLLLGLIHVVLQSQAYAFGFLAHALFYHFAVSHAPPPAPVQRSSGGSILGGIGSTIAQGMRTLAETFNI